MEKSYHYKILGWNPRTDLILGRWGFGIELDGNYAKRLFAIPNDPKKIEKLLEDILKPIVRTIMGMKDNDLFLYDVRINFWEDTCLLTNISVPGNACGLDMSHSDFAMLKHRPQFPLQYSPHNVDSMNQATALLAVWLQWYHFAEYLKKE